MMMSGVMVLGLNSGAEMTQNIITWIIKTILKEDSGGQRDSSSLNACCCGLSEVEVQSY